jgi:Rieske Fe-S protein
MWTASKQERFVCKSIASEAAQILMTFRTTMGCKTCVSRRRFLELSSKSLSALVLACPALELLTACSQNPLDSALGAGPTAAVLPNNSTNVYTLSFSDYPTLENVGGSVHTTVSATSGSKDLFVTRVDANTVVTVSTICTHAGCVLDGYNSATQQYLCPCHGSIFNAEGLVLVGPATTPLPTYVSILTASAVQITVP